MTDDKPCYGKGFSWPSAHCKPAGQGGNLYDCPDCPYKAMNDKNKSESKG